MAKKKRALITGVTGQDDSYLAEHLLEKGVWVPIMISEYPDGSWSADIRQDGRDLLTCHGGPIDRIIGRLATR